MAETDVHVDGFGDETPVVSVEAEVAADEVGEEDYVFFADFFVFFVEGFDVCVEGGMFDDGC